MIWLWLSLMVYIIFISYKYAEYRKTKSFNCLLNSVAIFIILALSYIIYLLLGKTYQMSQLFDMFFCLCGIYTAFSLGRKAVKTLERGFIQKLLFLCITMIVSVPFIALQLYSIAHSKVNTFIRFESLNEFYDTKNTDYAQIYVPMSHSGWRINSEYIETERTEFPLLVFPADSRGYDISRLFYSVDYESPYTVRLNIESKKCSKEQFFSNAERIEESFVIEQERISEYCYYQQVSSPYSEEEIWFIIQFISNDVYYNVHVSVQDWDLVKKEFPSTYFKEELLKVYYSATNS